MDVDSLLTDAEHSEMKAFRTVLQFDVINEFFKKKVKARRNDGVVILLHSPSMVPDGMACHVFIPDIRLHERGISMKAIKLNFSPEKEKRRILVAHMNAKTLAELPGRKTYYSSWSSLTSKALDLADKAGINVALLLRNQAVNILNESRCDIVVGEDMSKFDEHVRPGLPPISKIPAPLKLIDAKSDLLPTPRTLWREIDQIVSDLESLNTDPDEDINDMAYKRRKSRHKRRLSRVCTYSYEEAAFGSTPRDE